MTDTSEAARHLVEPSSVISRPEALGRPSAVPAVPGLYVWYFDEAPPGVSVDGCHVSAHGVLLYLGIAPKEPPKSGGTASEKTLRDRIRTHFAGTAAKSTLRLSLGCHLANELDLRLRRVASGVKCTFTPAGEAALSQWMSDHARVAVLEHVRPWELEPFLIKSLSLPLNIEHNASHPYYRSNRDLRAKHKAEARALPIWTPTQS